MTHSDTCKDITRQIINAGLPKECVWINNLSKDIKENLQTSK